MLLLLNHIIHVEVMLIFVFHVTMLPYEHYAKSCLNYNIVWLYQSFKIPFSELQNADVCNVMYLLYFYLL
jgi:hypothetical protein